MATFTVITLPNGKEIGRVEIKRAVVNGIEVFEKTYVMSDESEAIPEFPEANGTRGRASKWTREQAQEIIRQHSSRGGRLDTKSLAAAYKVSVQTINNLITGKTKQFKR